MKHFLNIQNGHIFALFLCIFTNFFLVLLIKKVFLRLLLCIFHNRQKKCRKSTRRCGQHASSGMHATCEQHTQTSISASKSQYSFSCQLLPILLLYRTQRLLAARLIPPGASRQTPHAAVLLFLPVLTANNIQRRQSISQHQQRRQHLFLQSKSQTPGLQQPHFHQPLSTFTHSVLQPFKHSTSPFSINFPPKKLSLRLSFSRCI